MTRATLVTATGATGPLAAASNITALELQSVLSSLLGETHLRTEIGFVPTRADLIAASWAATGSIVQTFGHAAIGDGGAAQWKILASGTADGYVTINMADGRKAQQVQPASGSWDVRRLGVFSTTPAATTSAALLALWNHLKANEGGEIFFATNVDCGPTTFLANTELTTIRFKAAQWVDISPVGVGPSEWMWNFDDEGVNLFYLQFDMVNIYGNKTTRPVCNGVRVGATNQLYVRGCFGRFIDGTAWRFERVYNGQINVKTFASGRADLSAYAHEITGSTWIGSGADATPGGDGTNDVIIDGGASEQDYAGLLIECGINVRFTTPFKVHGSATNTVRAVHIHRCSMIDAQFLITQRWKTNGHILITDAGAETSQGVSLRVPFTDATTNTRARVDISTIQNRTCIAPANSTVANILVDLQNAASKLILTGFILPQPAPTNANVVARDVEIAATTANIDIDYSGLLFDKTIPVATRLVDNRTGMNQASKNWAVGNRGPRYETVTALPSAGVLDLEFRPAFAYAPASAATITGFANLRVGEECEIRFTNGNTSLTASSGLLVNSMPSGSTRTFVTGERITVKRFLEGVYEVSDDNGPRVATITTTTAALNLEFRRAITYSPGSATTLTSFSGLVDGGSCKIVMGGALCQMTVGTNLKIKGQASGTRAFAAGEIATVTRVGSAYYVEV